MAIKIVSISLPGLASGSKERLKSAEFDAICSEEFVSSFDWAPLKLASVI